MKGGEYENFLKAFKDVVNKDSAKYNFLLKNINSPGASGSTLEQLDKGKADLGLVQSNAKWNSKNISAIGYVYSELYFLITNNTDIHSLRDIAACKDSLRIARLAPPSQTSKDLLNLINFYDIDTAKLHFINSKYDECYQALKEKKVDIGFLIVGLGNPVISKILKDKSLHLINFENLDAYLLRRNKMSKFILPMGIYGLNKPEGDYQTFSTKAMLVVSNQLGDKTVYNLTKALFEKESELVNEYPFFQLQRISNEGETYIPVHQSALQYYERDKPMFLDRNSNLITTLLSILGLLLSGIPLYLEYSKSSKNKNKFSLSRSS